jgi:transcriptional regulator with XRE-family HTH domain
MKTVAGPGAVLKALRTEKGLTLAEVSRLTGLPVSTVSKVENDKMSLSYDKLARISRGLDIDIGLLFSGGGAPAVSVNGRRSIARAGQGKAIVTRNYDNLYPATDLLNKRFIPIVAQVRARSLAEFGEMVRHPGEEYAYVLEGAVELHTDLYAPVRLEQGDSMYFDSGMAHAYIAASDGPCRVLSICSGAESQLIAALDKAESLFGPNATPATSRTANAPSRRADAKARLSRRTG